jgi:hypothetical protein
MSDILARDNIPLAVNQVEYSILRQLPEKSGLLAEMKKRNIMCLGCTYAWNLSDAGLTCRFSIGHGTTDWKVQCRQPSTKEQKVSTFHLVEPKLIRPDSVET